MRSLGILYYSNFILTLMCNTQDEAVKSLLKSLGNKGGSYTVRN